MCVCVGKVGTILQEYDIIAVIGYINAYLYSDSQNMMVSYKSSIKNELGTDSHTRQQCLHNTKCKLLYNIIGVHNILAAIV